MKYSKRYNSSPTIATPVKVTFTVQFLELIPDGSEHLNQFESSIVTSNPARDIPVVRARFEKEYGQAEKFSLSYTIN